METFSEFILITARNSMRGEGRGGMPWQGGVRQRGTCMAGGMCGRGRAWQEGVHARETFTEAGGTHSTGIHSCHHCRITKVIVQRHLKKNLRNATTYSHFLG